MELHVPDRLTPYIDDLCLTGLWGSTAQDVAIRLIERAVEYQVQVGNLELRENGKKLPQE